MSIDLRDFENRLRKMTIQDYLQMWPLATFIVVLMGYIGFYTYASKFRITFSNPELSVIIGIGLFNLLSISLIYFSTSKKKEPTSGDAFLVTSYILYLISNPIAVAGVALIHFQFNEICRINDQNQDNVNIGERFRNKRRLVKNKLNYLLISTILFFGASISIGVFWNLDFFLAFSGVSILLNILYRLRKKKNVSLLALLILIIVVPLLTSNLLLKDINFTVFGLVREKAIIFTEKQKYDGIVLFKSPSETHILVNDSTIVLPNNRIILTTKDEQIIKPESGIEFFKKSITDLKKYIHSEDL